MAKEHQHANGAAKDEAAHEALIKAKMDRMARETLTGDVRDLMLNELKDLKGGGLQWNLRSEPDQKKVIEQVTVLAERTVSRVCEIVAAQGQEVIRAHMKKITITSDGIKADMEIGTSDQQRHKLFDAAGKFVAITLADPGIFTGERAPAEITKQQKEMFDGGDPKEGEPPKKPGEGEPQQPAA